MENAVKNQELELIVNRQENDNVVLKTENSEFRARIEALEIKVAEQGQIIAELKVKVSVLESENAELRAENAELKVRVEKQDRKIKSLSSSLSHMKRAKREQKMELDDLWFEQYFEAKELKAKNVEQDKRLIVLETNNEKLLQESREIRQVITFLYQQEEIKTKVDAIIQEMNAKLKEVIKGKEYAELFASIGKNSVK